MKLLVLAVLIAELLVVAVNVSGQPNQAANDKHKQTQERNAIAGAPETQQNASAAKQGNGDSNGKPSKWYTAIERPEWLLTVAAFLTLVVVTWQSVATARATKAMQKSVTLQEANMRQWVDVEIVGVQHVPIASPQGELVIQIKFKAVNNTSLPFKIKKVVTHISRNREPEKMEWEIFEVEDEVTLPPSKEARESSYPFFAILELEGPAIKTYLDDKFLLSIGGCVFIEPAVGSQKLHPSRSLT
jgi:hypothetical protein